MMERKGGKTGPLLLVLTLGVFSIINTEMGVVGILPMVSVRYGVEISAAGLLVSLFALAVAGSGPILPLLFSRFRRKAVMLAVLGVFTACNVVSAFAESFPVLLTARILPAFFQPVYVSMAFSLAAASVEPARAPKAVAKVMMGVSAGMVLGCRLSAPLQARLPCGRLCCFWRRPMECPCWPSSFSCPHCLLRSGSPTVPRCGF